MHVISLSCLWITKLLGPCLKYVTIWITSLWWNNLQQRITNYFLCFEGIRDKKSVSFISICYLQVRCMSGRLASNLDKLNKYVLKLSNDTLPRPSSQQLKWCMRHSNPWHLHNIGSQDLIFELQTCNIVALFIYLYETRPVGQKSSLI